MEKCFLENHWEVTKMTFDSDLLSTESVRAASNIYMVVVDLCSKKDVVRWEPVGQWGIVVFFFLYFFCFLKDRLKEITWETLHQRLFRGCWLMFG